MSRLQRIAELARLEHYGKITPEQSAALAELRARAQQQGQTLSQFISPMLTVGSSIVAEPVSGLAGIAGTVLPGEQGQGARWVQGTQDALTYQPKDEAGQRGVQAVGEFFQPVSDAMDKATQAVGDAGYRMGGPALGAAASTIPTAVSELAGIGKPARAVNVMDNIVDGARETRVPRMDFEREDVDGDVYYHTSPGRITELEDRPNSLFGDNLFFSTEPYSMGGDVLYGIRMQPDDVIESTSIPFLDLDDAQREVYNRAIDSFAKTLGTDDLDLAEDILTERKDIYDYVDELGFDDYEQVAELSWTQQRILGDLGRDLGYKGVRATDEQGSVLIAPMRGRESELTELLWDSDSQ